MTTEGYAEAYAEAVEHERLVRDASFLINPVTGLPLTERIGEFEVFPMNLNHYIALKIQNNPLIFEGEPSYDQIAQFLWCLSVDYQPSVDAQQSWLAARCGFFLDPPRPKLRTPHAMLKWESLFCEALEKRIRVKAKCELFVKDTLQDKPPTKQAGERKKSYYSEACKWSAIIAREYPGTDVRCVMQIPLKQLFQYLNEIKEFRRLDVPLCNPSDEVSARWQAAQVRKN